MSNVSTDATAIVAAVAVIGLVGPVTVWLMRKGLRLGKRIGYFLDDFMGTPARPGVEAAPGVMARLQTLTESQAKLAEDREVVQETLVKQTAETKQLMVGFGQRLTSIEVKVSEIHHETQPNGGDSMKDQMNRVDQALKSQEIVDP